MDKILAFMRTYFDWFYITTPDISDIIEILILSYVIYKILMWFKSNRAWTLLKGIVLILLFTILASLFQFNSSRSSGEVWKHLDERNFLIISCMKMQMKES